MDMELQRAAAATPQEEFLRRRRRPPVLPSRGAPSSPSPQKNAPRRRDRDSMERRDDRGGPDFDRPPNRRGGSDYYDRNRSPPPPPRDRDRDYKRRSNMSPPPLPYRDRRHSPPPRRSPPYIDRRVVYSTLGGAFSALLLFRTPVTRWAAVAFGAGVGLGSAYSDCFVIFLLVLMPRRTTTGLKGERSLVWWRARRKQKVQENRTKNSKSE
ncbi:hypothetical protein Tsubulata_012341 [Turnera subulata]|uniref:Uncharacterized protein n=1 Tax=Turnera subulata TaxID=218843 RepID=A0A9Q0G2I5_9ROSI|nr:hypothetical protein Tsubulata_012341 [Turnera subulata]